LTAFTFEGSTGESASISLPFEVQIAPVPDPFLVVVRNIDLDGLNPTFSNIELRMEDNRTVLEPNEIPNEYVEFIYRDLPAGIRLLPTAGGRLLSNGNGTFVFTGTPDQANSLFVVSSGPNVTAGTFNNIPVSGVSIDDNLRLSPPISDSFRLRIEASDLVPVNIEEIASVTGNSTVTGGAGNDILNGDGVAATIVGGDGNDLLIGGNQSDVMTGGTGLDVFQWFPDDIGAGITDTITDFNLTEGDIINVSEVLNGLIEYNPQDFDINDFLVLTVDVGGNVELAFNPALGLGTDSFVVLTNPSGFTGPPSLTELFTNGNLLI
jgi:hypothetical protein